jgi:spore coat protein A
MRELSRREFLGGSLGTVAAAAFVSSRSPHSPRSPRVDSLDIAKLARFVDPLPVPPVVRPDASGTQPLAMRAIESRVHRDLPPTRFWSFGSTFPGPTIETRRGRACSIEWANELPTKHFLPIDRNIHGAEASVPDVRAVVHVHGAKVPPDSDGLPERWFVPGKSARYVYPNDQDAATLWYHDHTMGINRLNVFAGLFGAWLIRDDVEEALNLPKGDAEIPLLICDRAFDGDAQLAYPTSGDPNAPWVPEFFGDALLVNGKLFPFLAVERRSYRFRVINTSNSRFLRLSLPGCAMQQIGSDQGLLAAPVAVEHLHLAPAERVDVVVDFATRAAGDELIVQNDGQPVMQIRISRAGVAVNTGSLPATLRAVTRLAEADAVRTRVHSLAEDEDLLARPMRMLLNNTGWHRPVTEQPTIDTTEIWSLVNITDDTHPIHLHLVRFQILDRRKFDVFTYRSEGRIAFTGPPVPPSPAEAGWKDTVRADAGMVTRIIMRFEGYTGRYMWHCHILEHGDNEMMRPFEVLPAAAPATGSDSRALD